MNTLIVPPEGAGRRLDAWLATQRRDLSRARIQDLIRAGHVTVNGRPVKASSGLVAGMTVSLEVPLPIDSELRPESIPLDVLYEDDDLLAINKPAGLVVHPAAGHASGTLVNALLAHCPNLPGINGEKRPGIVHRLDRDTTGVIVVAKTDLAMRALVDAFKARTVRKEYAALVWGVLTPPAGRVETLIGRSSHNRKKMSASPSRGRAAITLYETVETFADASRLKVRIETGRTHQIRVHMAWLGHPVIGDKDYGRQRPNRLTTPLPTRQMLHAERLTLSHPRTGKELTFAAPWPEDMRVLLAALQGETGTQESKKHPTPP